jgi:hypothetical protein
MGKAIDAVFSAARSDLCLLLREVTSKVALSFVQTLRELIGELERTAKLLVRRN